MMAAITICVHFVVLTIGRQADQTTLPGYRLLFTWTWPSMTYALGIAAWDFCLGFALLLAAPRLLRWRPVGLGEARSARQWSSVPGRAARRNRWEHERPKHRHYRVRPRAARRVAIDGPTIRRKPRLGRRSHHANWLDSVALTQLVDISVPANRPAAK